MDVLTAAKQPTMVLLKDEFWLYSPCLKIPLGTDLLKYLLCGYAHACRPLGIAVRRTHLLPRNTTWFYLKMNVSFGFNMLKKPECGPFGNNIPFLPAMRMHRYRTETG